MRTSLPGTVSDFPAARPERCMVRGKEGKRERGGILRLKVLKPQGRMCLSHHHAGERGGLSGVQQNRIALRGPWGCWTPCVLPDLCCVTPHCFQLWSQFLLASLRIPLGLPVITRRNEHFIGSGHCERRGMSFRVWDQSSFQVLCCHLPAEWALAGDSVLFLLQSPFS